jgi:hypothetical protein
VPIPHNRARLIAVVGQVPIVKFFMPCTILFRRAADALPGGFGPTSELVDIAARDISFNVGTGATAVGEPRGAP